MSENKKGRAIISFDWAIKTLLRDKANADILEGLLSALFKFDVEVLELLESESNRYQEDLKSNRVDVLAKINGGEKVIIEVQYESEAGFIKRILYGTSKAIVESLKVGAGYEDVVKVFSVSIVYFNIGEGDDYVYHGKTEFRGIHTQGLLKIKNNLTVGDVAGDQPCTLHHHDVMPEYFLIPLNCFKGEVNDAMDEWIYAIKNMEVLDSFKSKGMAPLKDKMGYLNMSVEEQRTYRSYMERAASARGTLKDAKRKGREEGRKEGREEGHKEGIEKGREEGMEKGREEGLEQARKQAAKKMKEQSVTVSIIAQCTGLSAEEIESL